MICEADPPEDADQQLLKGPAPIKHGGCGNAQPEIRRTGLQLWASWKARKGEDDEDTTPDKKRIFPTEVLRTFRTLTDETLELMGLNLDYARPEWMILSALPVPPLQFVPASVWTVVARANVVKMT